MYEALKDFNSIVVSGPQRSGTRITAKIIAVDTSKNYIDEQDIAAHDFRLLEYYLNQGNVVIQCPALCHLLHYIKTESTLVIVVYRNIEDIITSEARIWKSENEKIELFKYGYSSGIISRIKYNFWEKVQKPILGEMARDINYTQLEKHPLFIKDRKDFKWNQTTL